MKCVPLLIVLFGLTACSQGYRPRLGEDANPPPAPRAESAPTAEAQPGASIEGAPQEDLRARVMARCELKMSEGSAHARRLGEYAELRDRIEAMSPLLAAHPELHAAAHLRAFVSAKNAIYSEMFSDPQLSRLRLLFRRNFSLAFGSFVRPPRLIGNVVDLLTMFGRVLYIPDGSSCANLFLETFYREYVRALDPFAQVEFGDAQALSANTDPTGSSTLGLELEGATGSPEYSVVFGAPLVSIYDSVPWITLRDLDLAESLESALQAAGTGKVVIDLRFSAGKNLENLQKLRTGFGPRSEGASALILVNSFTRGTAAVWAHELSTRADVRVIGSEPMTYGYARLLKREVAVLSENVSAISLVLGAESVGLEGENETVLSLAADDIKSSLTPGAVLQLFGH